MNSSGEHTSEQARRLEVGQKLSDLTEAQAYAAIHAMKRLGRNGMAFRLPGQTTYTLRREA